MPSRIHRGDIFLFDLGKPPPGNHVMADPHPVVVVQCDEGNDNSSMTVVAACTRTIKSKIYGWDCILEAGARGDYMSLSREKHT